jgi:trimeric autotransporter adhesin
MACRLFALSFLSVSVASLALSAPHAGAQSTTMPAPVVASSSTTVATGLNQPQGLALDAAGNLFVSSANSGTVVEFPANGGASVVVINQPGSYNKGVTVDSLGNIYTTSYGGSIYKAASGAGAGTGTVFATGSTCPDFAAIGYYIGWQDVSADGQGNIFAAGQGKPYLFEFDQMGACTERLTPAQLGSMDINNVTADAAGDVYFSVANNIYYLPVGSSTPTQVMVAGIAAVNGLKVDAKGDLFITDSMTIDEIPVVNGALAPTQLTYLFPAGAPYTVGVAPSGAIYASNFNASTVQRYVVGSLILGSSNVGTASAPGVLTYTFNAATTPTSFSYISGPNASTVFSTVAPAAPATTTCMTDTAYPASTGATPSSCTLNIGMNASTPGKNTGAVLLNTATTTVTTSYLAGTGVGAALTVFPGAQTSLGTFTTPSAIRVDGAGDVFVADSAKNTVTEIPTGGGTPVTVGSGLSMPQGLVVDSAGNLFIADTGNNRVVEVPFSGGSLKTASQTVVATGFNAPMGLALDLSGNLLVANSGAGTVSVVPNQGGVVGSLPTYTIGSGLKTPVAIAVDAANNIFIADTMSADIVEVSASGSQSTVLNNLANLAGLAVDANDDIFISQTGSTTITGIPITAGSFATNSTVALGTGFSAPKGITLDGAGNLYIADATGGMAYEIQRTMGSLGFGRINVVTSSAAQSLTLSNTGNAALKFSSPFYEATAGNTGDFAVSASSNDGCAAGLATGTSCGVSVTFSPTAIGARMETLSFQSNAVNGSPIGANFTGTGTNSAPTTLALSVSPSGTISFNQTLTVTATVAPVMASTLKPTGTVQFTVDGFSSGAPANLSNSGTANQTINGLSSGAHTINATYSGDDSFASAAASTPLGLTIGTAPTTTALTSTINGTVATPSETAVTFTATVNSVATPPYPSGSVSFFQAGNATALGSAPLTNGVASFTTTALANGQYNVTAVYSGDPDFSMSTSPGAPVFISPPTYVLSNAPSSLSVHTVGSAATSFTLTSIAGYIGSVYLGCTGLPQYATCTFSPGGVDFAVTPGPQAVQLTVNTGQAPPMRGGMPWLASLLTLGTLLILGGGKRLPRLLTAAMILIGAAVATASLSSCASTNNSTPSDSAMVTVQLTGTPGPSNTNVLQSFTFSLQVH